MKTIILTIILCLFTVNAEAAQKLLMFYSSHCGYCQKWDKEIGVENYSKTDIGQALPIQIIDEKDGRIDWIVDAVQSGKMDYIRGTPTFVVWDDKLEMELTRLVGYAGKENFYENLGLILKNITNSPQLHQQPEKESSGFGNSPHMSAEPPVGVLRSRKQTDHRYRTPEEARKAAEWLGFGKNIHAHETNDGSGLIWMPGSMN